MRIRPSVSVFSACLVLIAGACGGNDSAKSDASPASAMGVDTVGWGPSTLVDSCADLAEHLSPAEAEAEFLSEPIEIYLGSDGELAVDPEIAVVSHDQTIRFYSDSLRWTVAFAGDRSPMRELQKPIRGEPDGEARPEGDAATIPSEAKCGRYIYAVGAVHPGTGDVYVLDPPIIVKD